MVFDTSTKNCSLTEYSHTLDVIKDFVSDKLGIPKALLTGLTKIEDDVAVAGLDTYTFYEDYSLEFQISNLEDFQAASYVTPESLQVKQLLKSIFSRRERQKLLVKSNTLGHLTRVALTKRWFEENQ